MLNSHELSELLGEFEAKAIVAKLWLMDCWLEEAFLLRII